MSSLGDATVPSTRRSRKSVGGQSPSRKAAEKENATIDVGSTLAASRKKSRSKSMGPGGLDVLKGGSGNRRVSLAVPSRPPPRSILKPTIPLLPEIPPHKKKEIPVIDLGQSSQTATPPTSLGSNDSAGSKVALRTEAEQQAAARERDERERRDARRKSLANRRVSFAAEATLHTFHEIEYMHDSTTSTDSTRRASSIAAPSPAPADRPTTPQEQAEDVVPESPDNQRELHQKKRRRSSAVPPVNFNQQEDETTASVYSSDSEPADAVEEIQADEDSNSNSSNDSDDDEGTTMMSLDADEVTGASVLSARSTSTTDENDTIDQALRMAARTAGTQQLGFDDEDGSDEEEIIPSFGWAKKANQPANAPTPVEREDIDDDGTEMEMDMEMTHAVGGILQSKQPQGDEQEEDMSMDVTRALGGILSRAKQSPDNGSQIGESGEDSLSDETMDMTMAIGGIQRPGQSNGFQDGHDDEDMSMELTTAIGGVLPAQNKRKPLNGRRRTIVSSQDVGTDDATMDMTLGLGRILPTGARQDSDGDVTMGMDMTMAIGGIIKGLSSPTSRIAAKKLMEEEVNRPDSPSKTLSIAPKSPAKKLAAMAKQTPSTVESESPGLDPFRGAGLRRSMPRNGSAAPQPVTESKPASPAKPTTPSRKADPTPNTIAASSRTPQSQQKSPARPKSPARKPATPSPAKPINKALNVFQQDPATGAKTPTIVLTPQARRLSGIGADKSGLGSPRVAAIFDRRGSIGEAAQSFVPGLANKSRGVAFAFEDPRVIEYEVDKERQDEEDKEDGRKILEREVDGAEDDKDATLNLREMIQSLSPKKKPLKGRKSLHVGSASGLLGKRPAELDNEEEAEEKDGIKRLKGHQGSPVKNIRLQQPPSKAETTGRLTRSARRSLEEARASKETPTHTQLPKKGVATTPKGQGRFKHVDDDTVTHPMNLAGTPIRDETELENEGPEDRIHLQSFLNMTSIRFMELTTTKRRHTQAPDAFKDGSSADSADDMSLERCVVAGACTVPMLELYQHSCRELKKYISEGRRIVREIETETLEENPPLFREYISAAPDVKAMMDNQFKNVKTHARLLSKAMWYEWRMKLQDGLKEGLVKIADGMAQDEKLLQREQELLATVIPAIVAQFEALAEEHENLEAVAQELADCDPTELEAVRLELTGVESDIETKTRRIAELRQQLEESETGIEQLAEQKQRCVEDIKESEKIREECRGWSTNEISALRDRVDVLEKQHGWAVTGIAGSTVSMTYQREIELVFDIASFQLDQENSQIDLWYIAGNRECNPQPSTPEKEFFLQCIRDHVRGLPQSRTKIPDLLHTVRAAWDKTNSASDDIRLLNVTFPTTVNKTSDSSVTVCASLLISPIETKVEVAFALRAVSTTDGLEFMIQPDARVVYGEHFNIGKIAEFLATHLSAKISCKGDETASWSDVVVDLHERLLARGRK